MAIINLVKFEGPPLALAWKYPNEELSTWTQLIVNESQEALFVKGGQALDLFGPGRHTLSSQNIPLLSSIMNLPFGGKSPFTAEVWYVNKAHTLDIKWGTPSPIQLQDPKYQLPVSVRAFGQFGVQIEHARKFLIKMNGTLPLFDQAALVKHFSGVLLMNVNKLISGYLVHNKISILDINAYVEDISKHMEQTIGPVFDDYGIQLVNFNVVSINIPDNDNVTQRLKDALAKRAEMDILGFTYQQERTFNTLEGAATKNGLGSSIMDAGLGAAMGIGIGGPIGQNLAQLTSQMSVQETTRACPKCQAANKADARFCHDCGQSLQSSEPVTAKVPCDNCGKPVDPTAKFCSHCGDAVRPCPSCKADNPQHVRNCIQCGTALPVPCQQCGHSLAPGAKFCPECGTSAGLSQCGQCKADVQPGQKFCLACGHKLS